MDEYHNDIFKKLYNLEHLGSKLGLENITKLLAKIDNPQKKLKFIHVAGTNGKGSVCALVAKGLSACGFKVGFHSSPHLVSIRERFRINGKGISSKELCSMINDLWPYVNQMYADGKKLTFFEVTVAIAFQYFYKNDCDFVVLETGLGGRLDSTNVVCPEVTAITSIGIDHEKFLGNTEEKIALEKAGIIKKKIPIFVGEMISATALKVIKEKAFSKNAPLFFATDAKLVFSADKNPILGWNYTIKNNKTRTLYHLPLPGYFQKNNMKIANQILNYLSIKYNFRLNDALKGIEKIKWPARLQVLPDGKILDGGHNLQGIKSLVETLQNLFPKTKFKIVFGCLQERNPTSMLSLLSTIAQEFIFVPINTARGYFPPNEMASIIATIDASLTIKIVSSIKQALAIAKTNRTLIIGSLYLAGDTLLEYYPEKKIINI